MVVRNSENSAFYSKNSFKEAINKLSQLNEKFFSAVNRISMSSGKTALPNIIVLQKDGKQKK